MTSRERSQRTAEAAKRAFAEWVARGLSEFAIEIELDRLKPTQPEIGTITRDLLGRFRLGGELTP